MSKDLDFLINLVKDASLLITNDMHVKAKDDKGDLVTNFDYEIEKYMIENIKKEYPDFAIVSEEFNSNNELTENCFTIDPIDGTINFANGIPLWAIQVACIKEGKTVAAVIYMPKFGELYSADENGAFLNGNPIHVNNLDIKHGLYNVEGPGKLLGQIKMRDLNRHSRNFYSAAVNFAWTACGKLSGASFVWHTVWDYVPGQFIVEKAGGVIYNDDKIHIAANNKELLEILKEKTYPYQNEKVEIIKIEN